MAKSSSRRSSSKRNSDKPIQSESKSNEVAADSTDQEPSPSLSMDEDNEGEGGDEPAPAVVVSADADGVQTIPPDEDPPAQPPAAPVAPTRPRLGSSHQPRCPYCSTDEKEVLCTARSTRTLITYYSCKTEGCTFSVKIPRPDIGDQVGRRRRNQGFSAR